MGQIASISTYGMASIKQNVEIEMLGKLHPMEIEMLANVHPMEINQNTVKLLSIQNFHFAELLPICKDSSSHIPLN